MRTFLSLLLFSLIARFRTRASLEAELVALRHQVLVLRRRRSSRPPLNVVDRLIWIWLYRLSPGCLSALVIVRPETVVRDGAGPVSAPGGAGNHGAVAVDQRSIQPSGVSYVK